jgi:NAD-dependent SIR2 family protein deacetylase
MNNLRKGSQKKDIERNGLKVSLHENSSFRIKERILPVLFGEMLPEKAILKSQQEAAKSELFIVLGSSLRVSPANYFPLDAKENGAKLVIVNMERTDFDHLADMVINNRFISEVLQEL